MEVSGIRTRAAIVLMLVLALSAAPAVAGRRIHRGDAIYYANMYAGGTMACGGKYQPWKMVAAHRKLPCGSLLRVKNLSNGKIVKVRVKDRGPYGADAILDVSRKAAKGLGFWGEGRTRVKAVVLRRGTG